MVYVTLIRITEYQSQRNSLHPTTGPSHPSVLYCSHGYLSSQVVAGGQVFEAVEAVPMPRPSTAWVMMDNLTDQSAHRQILIQIELEFTQ